MNNPQNTSGISFGGAAPNQSPFSFGAGDGSNINTVRPLFDSSAAAAQQTGFGGSPGFGSSFGPPATTQPPAFGAVQQSNPPLFGAPQSTQPTAFGAPQTTQTLSFGNQGTPQTAPFNFSSTPTQAPAFSVNPTTTASNPNLGFGQTAIVAPTTAAAAPKTGGFVFGTPPTGVAPTTSTSTFPNLLPNPATTANTLTISSTPGPAVTTSTVPPTSISLSTGASAGGGFSFGAPTTTTAANPGFLLAGKPPAISTQPLSLGLAKTTAATITTPSSNLPTSLTTGTTTTQSSTIPASQLNFCELEELINKWNLALEEQEKLFTNQATQVNAWDKLLIENGDKIVSLNDAVEKIKAEQNTLEQELEFISAQHSELEEFISPLQKDLSKISQIDVERSQIYSIAENLDTQLKQMSEDLKEVIEHLNEANKAQDPNDPIVQIGRILNAHMGSLQWIESSISCITNKLDETTKIHENLKRDNERSLRFVYYNQ